MKSITSKLSIIILSLFVSAFTYGQSDSQAFTACIAQMSQYSPPTSMYGGQDVKKMQYNMDGISTIRSCANQYQASCGTQISAWNGPSNDETSQNDWVFTEMKKLRSCANQS